MAISVSCVPHCTHITVFPENPKRAVRMEVWIWCRPAQRSAGDRDQGSVRCEGVRVVFAESRIRIYIPVPRACTVTGKMT